MDTGTVQIEGVGVAALALTPTWSGSHTEVSYTHHNFLPGRTYELTIRGRDNTGNPIGPGDAPNPWRFTTIADGAPPTATVQALGGTGQGPLALSPLQLTFSEPVRQNSMIYTLAPQVAGAWRWSDDTRSALFLHAGFEIGQTYTFTLLAVQDLAGNRLPQPIEFSFVVQPTKFVQMPLVLHH